MTYIAKPMTIKTRTNLHVGSDSINYDIVDKTVQRDTITYVPIINASSHKGALRNFFQLNSNNSELIEFIFGQDGKETTQGYIKFLDSYLLFLPLRANDKPFYYVTSKNTLLEYCNFYENLGYDLSEAKDKIVALEDNTVFHNLQEETIIESIVCNKNDKNIQEILELLGISIEPTQVAIFSDSYFIDATKHLPVIARNRLKDGVSENLWYEEVVPRESLFYTAMLEYTNYSNRLESTAKNYKKEFFETVKNNIIQIGANASIGFGLCDYKLLQLPTKEV